MKHEVVERIAAGMSGPGQRVLLGDDALIPGFIVREITSEIAVKPDTPITNFNRAYGILWYGNQKPTLILSSKAVADFHKNLLIPIQLKPAHRGCCEGFKINHASWVSRRDIPEGRVFLLNENEPADPRYNGYYDIVDWGKS